MAAFTRKERREARKFERRLAKRLKRQQTPGVAIELPPMTITNVRMTHGLLTIEGIDENGAKVVRTGEVQNPEYPPEYSISIGKTP